MEKGKTIMVTDILATYSEWEQSFLREIEAQPHSVAKGDVFVQKILQIRYDLSETDAIDATECAGAGDRGIDALYIYPSEVDGVPHAIVVQGKYGSAGTDMNVYTEAQKFLQSLKLARTGNSINPSFDKIVGVITNQGIIHYVIATVEPLNKGQNEDLENVKKIASTDFGDKLIFEVIDLKKIYNTYDAYAPLKTNSGVKVDLHCRIINVQDGAFIGVASLVNVYKMLKSYASQSDDEVDRIYDRNIRKYLKRRTGSVNDGIYKTLEAEPQRFIAYNNGITIICRAAQKTEKALQLDTPYVVNGCQTTRTLYTFMETKFPGIDMLKDTSERLQVYKTSFIIFKVLVVKDIEDDPYAKLITRYSNKQNAIRGKDFIALEDMYISLKSQFSARGYFLETQAGEYDVLPKHRKKLFPKDTHVINSFEATLFYAAGILGKPHDAFGRSGDFMPGGDNFNLITNLSVDDLFIPWLIGEQAKVMLGYTTSTQRKTTPETIHRVQTRYHYLYLFFRFAREVVSIMKKKSDVTKEEIYLMLNTIKTDYDKYPREQHPFLQLLSLADEAIYTYMRLAAQLGWYTDRNSFLHREESINEGRIIQSTGALEMKLPQLASQVQIIIQSLSQPSEQKLS